MYSLVAIYNDEHQDVHIRINTTILYPQKDKHPVVHIRSTYYMYNPVPIHRENTKMLRLGLHYNLVPAVCSGRQLSPFLS